MRRLTLTAVMGSILCAAAGPALADPQLAAPIQRFIASFNKGDSAGAAATHAVGSDLSITDEVPPFLWRGPEAFQAWSAALDRDARRRGITDPLVTIGEATREMIDGDHAYVVVPAIYVFKERGVPMREAAQFTFVLQKSAKGWLIHGWTWTGQTAQKVAAPVRP